MKYFSRTCEGLPGMLYSAGGVHLAPLREEITDKCTFSLPPQTTASYVTVEPVRWMDFTMSWFDRKAPSLVAPYTIST